MEQKKNNSWLAISFFIIIMFIIIVANTGSNNNTGKKISALKNTYNSNTLNIISGSENKDLEEIVMAYANSKGYKVNIEYAGSLDIMQKLNSGAQYDAVWLSNSIWMYMLDSIKVSKKK